jgi:hypothetical protein
LSKKAQKITKNARFLQKNTKKYTFFTIFLPQNGTKPTNLRQTKFNNRSTKQPENHTPNLT